MLLHTGQHYDYEMSQAFFGELAIPKPDIELGVGSGTHAGHTGLMMVGIEQAAWKVKPDLVLVYGDTNSTLAGALVASQLHIPIGHVEVSSGSPLEKKGLIMRTMPGDSIRNLKIITRSHNS